MTNRKEPKSCNRILISPCMASTRQPDVIYNPSYEDLFEEETRDALAGHERGRVTQQHGAVAVDTGIFTRAGRPTTSISFVTR